ncbi:hypothetical protein ACFSC4_08540 [Deinococcus malanensis]|uniref:hypothetical protein n=1 Tax=Deinococcus malanensis TaxID=1706855 RepID=UPI001E3EA75B|nr:hypothetical protein [Deinococcus malanensis]
MIGSRAEMWLLETVFPNPAALDECLGAGMLQAEGTSLAFRHELARQAILETVLPQQRLHLHRCVLEALRAQSVTAHDYARLAHHAQEAGDPEAVLHYAPLSARRASGFRAHREAAAQYARALGFAEQLPPSERALLLEGYAQECYIKGQLEEAARARQEALTIWQRAGHREKEGENLVQLGRLYLVMGQNARAEQASQG